jgi:tetratricopeptide (TPR) repeat protein
MLLAENQYGTIPAAEASERAKPMFDLALSLDPASAEALAGLGLYFMQKGEEEQAIEILGKALSINPNLVNASNWLANAHGRLGHLEEVKRIRQENLVRDPLYLPGINNALDGYIRDGEIEEAQALMNRVRPYMPVSRTMVSAEGVLQFVSGRIADSLPYFESAYEMEPENPTSIGQLSRVLLYSWQYERLAEVGLDEFRVVALTRLNRIEEASKLAWVLVNSDYYVLPLLGLLAERGRNAELIEFVESRWSDLQAFEADYPERDGWSENSYLGLIAFSYHRLGRLEKFDEALSRFKAALDYQRHNGANNHWFAFAEAVYAVLAGEHDTALAKLARAFEGGSNPGPQLSKTWPMFEPLEGDPRYEAIVNGMVKHVISERAKLGLVPVGDIGASRGEAE